VLKKDDEEFWKLSMRRLWALFNLHQSRKERVKREQELAKQNAALEKMRAL
jgi:hypothetical protein